MTDKHEKVIAKLERWLGPEDYVLEDYELDLTSCERRMAELNVKIAERNEQQAYIRDAIEALKRDNG